MPESRVIPDPVPGKVYALEPPYLGVQVVTVTPKWVYLRLAPDVVAKGVPERIKRRFWAGYRPLEMTLERREELMDIAARIREAKAGDAAGVPLPYITRGGGLGLRGAALLDSVEGVSAPPPVPLCQDCMGEAETEGHSAQWRENVEGEPCDSCGSIWTPGFATMVEAEIWHGDETDTEDTDA